MSTNHIAKIKRAITRCARECGLKATELRSKRHMQYELRIPGTDLTGRISCSRTPSDGYAINNIRRDIQRIAKRLHEEER